MRKVKPIKPGEVGKIAGESIPDEVLASFNELIVKHWSPSSKASHFEQDAVVELIQSKLKCERKEIFDRSWLDVEKIYRAEGWGVKYESATYESGPLYPASYTFYKSVRALITRRAVAEPISGLHCCCECGEEMTDEDEVELYCNACVDLEEAEDD